MVQLKKEDQFYYEIDGKWKAFNNPRSEIGKSKTYSEYLDAIKPSQDDLVAINSESAKVIRDNAINDFIANFVGAVEFDGAKFQASERSYLDMSNAVRKAELNGYPDTDSRLWRLEDNSWRETTLAEIKQIMPMVRDVVDEANLQKWEDVWTAFNLWDAGDKQEPFEV